MEVQNNPENDTERLIGHCHSMAKKLLLEFGEFLPFGAYINNNNELVPTAYYDGDEFPLSETLIKGLKLSFEKKLNATQLLAYAITYDMQVTNEQYPNKIDTLLIKIFHSSTNETIDYYFPYLLQSKKIEFLNSWKFYSE